MKTAAPDTKPVLLLGDGNLTYSIAVCLLKAGQSVNLCSENVRKAGSTIFDHFSHMRSSNAKIALEHDRLNLSRTIQTDSTYELAIAISDEELSIKKDIVAQLENILSPNAVIAINTESIDLNKIQEGALHPQRIIGLNWTEPAHTTHFLEIIRTSIVKEDVIIQLNKLAKLWGKDPYIVENFGVRSRLISAMVREAFYLVENGYASLEDIDRACRNDAGYYLSFAGNCRYMDLMGTYAYGMVMKDLNPVLSKDQGLPQFFTDIIKEGGLGMENGKGLYQYTPDEVQRWRKVFNEFSYQIEEIINKYPFDYKKNGNLS